MIGGSLQANGQVHIVNPVGARFADGDRNDGAVLFSHSKVTIGSDFTNPATFQMLGLNNKISGKMASGSTLSAVGSDSNALGVVGLRADWTSAGTVVLDSSAVVVNRDDHVAGISGALVDIDMYSFANRGTIKIAPSIKHRQITGTGTFIHEGKIAITDNVVLGGDSFELSRVILSGGTVDGTVSFVYPTVNLDSDFTNPVAFEMLGFDNKISGTGGFTKVGAGTLTLGGANTYTGTTSVLTVNGGSAIVDTGAVVLGDAAVGAYVTAGDLTIGGDVALAANTLLTVNNPTSTTFSGVISGTGGLTKVGTGTLTLSGINTYSGSTSFDAGTLVVNGVVGGDVLVNAAGLLQGTGAITGNLTVIGTINAGN